MKEITMQRFHDILYKFFISLTLFGIGMLAVDLIMLVNRKPLYMFGQPMSGWDNLIPLLPVVLLIIGCYWMSQNHKKQSLGAKWR